MVQTRKRTRLMFEAKGDNSTPATTLNLALRSKKRRENQDVTLPENEAPVEKTSQLSQTTLSPSTRSQKTNFLSLPGEVRNMIYHQICKTNIFWQINLADILNWRHLERTRPTSLNVLETDERICEELMPISLTSMRLVITQGQEKRYRKSLNWLDKQGSAKTAYFRYVEIYANKIETIGNTGEQKEFTHLCRTIKIFEKDVVSITVCPEQKLKRDTAVDAVYDDLAKVLSERLRMNGTGYIGAKELRIILAFLEKTKCVGEIGVNHGPVDRGCYPLFHIRPWCYSALMYE